ncbi:MAG TPA: SRPBCC domain-containing protein [Candidatus Limnocylindria bacterium]|nr:SRPBCC domain-containing protein [Candidatus Limnocylindria bacterium]
MQQDIARDVRLAVPPERAWTALLDFDRVASWLPIVHRLRAVEPGRRYAAVLEDRVGPFALRADLTVDVAADEQARRLRVTASGEDRQVASRISATLEVTVTPDGDGALLAARGRYEITGRVATLGASAIRKKGEHALDQFFANAAREIPA